MEKEESVTSFLEESLGIFRKWREIDVMIDERPEQDDYKKVIFGDARSILFALYRAIDSSDEDTSSDIQSARIHLNSLVYESFSFLQYSLLKEISELYLRYDTDTLKTIFPKFYEKYARDIETIRKNLSKLSEKRKTLSLYGQQHEPHTSLDEMYADVLILKEILSDFSLLKLQFDKKEKEDLTQKEEEKENEKKKIKRDFRTNLLIALISALVGGVISYLITVYQSSTTASKPVENKTMGNDTLHNKDTLQLSK